MLVTTSSRQSDYEPPRRADKSVAIISAVDPYPSDSGKKIVLAGFIDYLSHRFGKQNVHYLMVGGDAGAERQDFPVQLHPLPKPTVIEALGNVMIRTITGRASLQESLLRSATVRTEIHRTLRSLRPTLEIYDTVRMAQYAPQKSWGRQVCYLDDLFSRRYASMLAAAERFPDVEIEPLNSFAAHVPSSLHPLATHATSQRLLLEAERRLIRNSEDRTARRFAANFLVNEQEADLLRKRAGVDSRRVQAIAPLITNPTSLERRYLGAPEFLFIGQLSMPHNEDGLRHFLSNIWPLVLNARPDARLTVVGRNSRPALTRFLAQHTDSVTLAGFVPDLNELLVNSAALISPLRFGSGVKLKVIDALGAATPVVATSAGTEGVVGGEDNGILVSDDDTEFAHLLLSTTDITRNRELSHAARSHFARRYSREAVFASYDAAFLPE